MLPPKLSNPKKRRICGFAPALCATIIAWVQMGASILLLLVLLVLGGQDKTEGASKSGLELVFCWPAETILLPRVFNLSIFLQVLGLVMGGLLHQAVKLRKVILLKAWFTYASLFVITDIMTQTFRGQADISLCPRIVLTTVFYLFSIWAARCHILDLNPPVDDLEDRIPFILNRIVDA